MPGSPVRRLLTAAAIALAAGCSRGGDPPSTTVQGLGSLSFPVRTRSAEARGAFERGMLLLHLFHYDEARASFRMAQAADPGLALAYWGEAMAWNYTVWNEQNRDSARAVLARFAPSAEDRRARTSDRRDAHLIEATDILYGDGPKARRDTLYHAAMAAASVEYPADDEITLLTALALLGLNQGVRDVPTYLAAADLVEPVFRRTPDHPGASHYLIHAVDDPDHAARGLDAARALARSSPDAGHGQHMTSHIFLALGMWDDVVAANENAARVSTAARSAAGRGPASCGHVNTWLTYGYLQQGRTDDARALTRSCIRQAEDAGRPTGYDPDPDSSPLASAVFIWSRFVLETLAWSGDDIAWNPAGVAGGDTPAAADFHFTRAFAAQERGDIATARSEYRAFVRVRTAAGKQHAGATDPGAREYLARLDIMALELEGRDQVAAGRRDRGLGSLRAAAEREDRLAYAFGPPAAQPAHEVLAATYLRLGRAAEAETAFRAAAGRNPGRASVLRGLAAALSAQGRTDAADSVTAALQSFRRD